MTIKVTGKNLDIGESLRTYVLQKIDAALDKYAGRSVSGHASVEKGHDGFTTHCAVHLASGLDMQSTGEGPDAYASVDGAMERLEKRLRRHRRRLKSHGQRGNGHIGEPESRAMDYVIDALQADDTMDAMTEPAAPAVIAETAIRIQPLSVGDAVMQMDLADRHFLVFRNAVHGGVNVVYKREDGNIGWIDPNGISSAKQA